MAFNPILYFSVGDGATADYVDLTDNTKYVLVPSGFSAPPAKAGEPYRTVTLTLYIRAADSNTLWDGNYRALETKLYQARRAAGPYGQLSGVTLGVQFDTTTMTYFDVVDGSLTPPGAAYSALYAFWLQKVTLTLTCYPLGRGAAQTLAPTATLAAGVNATAYWPAVAGDDDPLTRIQVTDCSLNGTVINRLRFGHRSLPNLAATDFAPFVDITPSAPGTAFADATATGGTCARLGTATATWQTVGQVLQPTAAAKTTGLFEVYARVRDGSVVYSPPSGLTATASKITRVQAANAQGTGGSLNVTWPAPTTAGNCPALVVQWSTGSGQTVTVPAAWGSPAVTIAGSSIWVIPNAAARSGSETVTASAASHIIATLIEYSGVASVSPVDQTNTNSGSSTTITVSTSLSTVQAYEELLAGFQIGYQVNNTYAAPAGWSLVTSLRGGLGSVDGVVVDSTQTAQSLESATIGLGASPVSTAWVGAILTLKGALVTSPTLSGTGSFAVVPVGAAGAVGPASSTVLVTFSASNSGALLSWTAPTTGGAVDHYLIYGSNGSTWSYVSTGAGVNATTAQVANFSGWTAAIGPPATNSGPSEWRAGIGLASGTVLLYGPETSTALGNGTWELVNLGVVPLPPTVAPEGSTPLPWQVQVQGKNASSSPTLDVDFVATVPHDEPQASAAYQDSAGTPLDLSTPRVWQFDSRRDERQSAVLYGQPIALTASGVTNNNDSTVTISAGTANVHMLSAGLLSASQGWVACSLAPSWASGTPPAAIPQVFWWGDATNRLSLRYAAGAWALNAVAAGGTTSATVAASFAAGSNHTVIGTWSTSTLGVGMDTTTLSTHAAGATPAITAGTAFIGNQAGLAFPVTAAVAWLALGTGVPSAADLTYLTGLGTTDLNPLTLSPGAALTLAWHATRTDFAMNAAEAGFVPLQGIARFGRGGNLLAILADASGGASDIQHTRFTVSVTVTPRYRLLTGAT